MLTLGTTAQAVASCLLFGLPFLLPYLRRTEGLTLAQGGALVAAPSLGMVVTLIAWGAFADRYGERLAIAVGLGLTGALGFASAGVSSLGARALLFALMGAAGASVNSASGRLVMGWFGAHQHAGSRSPYRRLILWRVHAASSLLVVPQFALAAFSAEYLVSQRGWDATTAGQLLAVVAGGGAAGRLAAGRWSDVVGVRLAPMRLIALAACVSMLLVALTAWKGVWLVVLALAVASIVSVADNGLGFTATAELAGRAWSGRALGVQNTMQNIAAFATAPLVGALAGSFGFAWAFAAVAVFPALGAWLTPVQGERREHAARVD